MWCILYETVSHKACLIQLFLLKKINNRGNVLVPSPHFSTFPISLCIPRSLLSASPFRFCTSSPPPEVHRRCRRSCATFKVRRIHSPGVRPYPFALVIADYYFFLWFLHLNCQYCYPKCAFVMNSDVLWLCNWFLMGPMM